MLPENSSGIDIQELIQLIPKGNEKAFSRLFGTNVQKLIWLLFAIVKGKDISPEMVDEVFRNCFCCKILYQ